DAAYIEYFFDRQELRNGNKLDATVEAAIRKCCIFMPIVSSNVENASPYVWREWNYAVNMDKEIWPVYKNFIDPDTLSQLNLGFELNAGVKERILNRNHKVGVAQTSSEDPINDEALLAIKNRQ